jgi:hypothetical protein
VLSLPDTQPFIGVSTDEKIITGGLEDATPHLLVSTGSGESAEVSISILLARGGFVIADPSELNLPTG